MSEEADVEKARPDETSEGSSGTFSDSDDSKEDEVPDPATLRTASRERRHAVDMVDVDFTPSWATETSEDLSLQRLIIAVNNITSGTRAPSKSEFTPVDRLLRCVNAVIQEKRQQFLHLRLQWLVFHLSARPEEKFRLPDALETPRSQQAQHAREAWWWNITNSSAQIKDMPDDLGNSPRSSSRASPRSPRSKGKEEEPSLKRAAKVAASKPKLERRFGTADFGNQPRTPPTVSPKLSTQFSTISPAALRAQTAPEGKRPKPLDMDARIKATSAVHKAAQTMEADLTMDAENLQKLQTTADNMLGTKNSPTRATSRRNALKGSMATVASNDKESRPSLVPSTVRAGSREAARRRSETLCALKEGGAFQVEDMRQSIRFQVDEEDDKMPKVSKSPMSLDLSKRQQKPEVPDIGKTWLIRSRTSPSPHHKSNSPVAEPSFGNSIPQMQQLEDPLWKVRSPEMDVDELLEHPRSGPLLPAHQPVAPFLRGVEPVSPGGTFQETKTMIRNVHCQPGGSWFCIADCLDSSLVEHRIKCKAHNDFARQGSSAPRRQRRIDWKIDGMCTKDRIQGIRRYIRLLKGTDATLKDELPPRPHTSASAGELPQLVRHGPKSRNPPLGAEESRDVSAVYAAMAAKRKKIPQAPKCLLPIPGTGEEKEGSSEGITLDLRGMNLTNDEAVPIVVGLRVRDSSFKAMLISGNPQLTDAFYEPLLRLACERSMSLMILDLSGSAHMGEKSICFLAHALPRALMRLRILKLDGTHFEEPSWCVLVEGLRCLTYLQELGLADMAIGRRSQDVACLVGELPLSLPGLKSLNLSGNFFSFEGCKALAHSLEGHGNLEILDLSYNAGGFVLTDSAGAMNIQAENLFSALRSDSRSQGISAFNPVSLVCEGVGKSKSLTTLKLVGCQLNFDEDFILEDALQSKQVGLEELDLGNNAFQGVMGVRCLLRILITHKSLKNLVLTNIREALPSCVAVPYEQSDPTARYTLNLMHPQHRALLRMLLRRCRNQKRPMTELFKFEERGDEILKMWNKNQSVPTQGHVSFAFRFPMELGVNVDPEQLISRVNEKRKLKVGLVDFVKVAQLFHGLADLEARLLFLEAMAVDLNLKLSHVRYLSELDPVLRTEVVDRLLPAVPEIHTLGGFDLAVHCGHSGASLCRDRTSIVNLLLFNPACADGRYEFDVSEPAHRKMLDDLIIVNHWERDCAMKLGRPDLSKHGDHECIRNCTVNGMLRIWRSADVQLPPRSEVKFDYCSPFHPKKGSFPSRDSILRQLQQAMGSMDFNQSLKVKVFRSVAHRLVLTPSQCSWVLDALPPTAMERDLELRESARVEAFVVLYARCNDISALLSDKEFGLFSLQHLTREEVLTVRKRLGRTRTWDLSRAGQECLVPQVDNAGDFNSAGRLKLVGRRPSAVGLPPMPDFLPVKPKTRSERVEEARLDAERMRPILQDYGMLDNPVSLGFANRYMMNLELHEDWHCAQCLLAVCKLEPGENIDEPYWSEKQHLAKKGSKWLVPDEWNKEIPQVGVFGMTFLQGLNDSDMELRMRLGEEFLGW